MGETIEASADDEAVEILPPAVRDRKGRLLPGQQSINPKGRPPIIRDIREAAKRHTRQALNTLISVMNDGDAPPASRVTAAEAILNRGWGKPMQNLEAKIEVTDTASIQAQQLMELTRRALDIRATRERELIDVTPASSGTRQDF